MFKKISIVLLFLFISANLFAVTGGHGKDDFVANRMQDKTGYLMPVGSMIIYASTTSPAGFLLCDGSSISTTTYSDLFNAIGYTYGGSTDTFKLPDMRETYAVGVGTRGAGVTAHDVFTLGEFKDDQLQGHTHQVKAPTSASGGNLLTGGSNVGSGTLNVGNLSGVDLIADGTNGTPRGGTVTRGKAIGVNYIIKY